jgi:hypothetical protein
MLASAGTPPEFDSPETPGAAAAGLLNRPRKEFDSLPAVERPLIALAKDP